MKLAASSALICLTMTSPALAMDIVDGAACAHLSEQIESLGHYNEQMLKDISEAQVSEDTMNAKKAATMLTQREALVSLRKTWISEYDSKCSAASMKISDFQKVCRPKGGVFNFWFSTFCKPLREAGL